MRVRRRLQDDAPADYLEFVVGSADAETAADISARVNWFLSDREVPVYMHGAAALEIRPDDAPHMDPTLVRDPGWERHRPPGIGEKVVIGGGLAALAALVVPGHPSTLASSAFSWVTDQNWFALHRRYGAVADARARAAAPDSLFARSRPGGSAFLLGTGPSAELVDPDRVDTDIRVICNSAVANQDLVARLRPDVVAFTDPVFHCGPSRYAAQFRADLIKALGESDFVVLTGDHWIGPVLANHPDIAERTVVLDFEESTTWRWPTPDDLSVRTTSNVLTLLMLPAGLALADRILVAGCDGRKPSENYFWNHSKANQYDDELMQSAFAAHPAFFRERDYGDYYDNHCAELEEFVQTAERAGKSVESVTPSYIPALVRRSTPAA